MKIPKAAVGKSFQSLLQGALLSVQKTALNLPWDIVDKLKPVFMRRNVWVPVQMENGCLHIATDDPKDLPRMDQIKALFSGQSTPVLCCL